MEKKDNGSVDTESPMENGQPPDPAQWGVADVVNYFRMAGFEEQASAFHDQSWRCRGMKELINKLRLLSLFVTTVVTFGWTDEKIELHWSQEIDGRSLLLMTRNDVLTGLTIKLGPALKIYEYHVKPLQNQHLKHSAL